MNKAIEERLAGFQKTLVALHASGGGKHSFLLDSVVGGERFGRYSFIGLAASSRLEVKGFECTEIDDGNVSARTTAPASS